MGKYNAYEKYKDSGIEWLGEIPEHWKRSIFRYYFDIQLGKMLQNEPQSENDEEISYLKAIHVRWNKVDTYDLPKMWASPKDKEKYYVKNGDLLICEGGEVGRTALLKDLQEDCIIQNALHRVRSLSQSNVKYLSYLMQHIADTGWLDILCNKSTISHLTSEKLSALPLPFPPLPEQQAIANFLDYKTKQIDALINKKETLLEKLDEKRTAIISHAVTKGLDPNVPMKNSGIEWLGEVPQHWHQKRLKFSVDLINNKIEAENSNLPYMGLEHIESWTGKRIADDNALSEGIASHFRPDDVLFGKLRPYLAKVYLSEIEGLASTEALVLRSKEDIYSKFLKYYILSRDFINIVDSSTFGAKMPRASWDFIGNLFLTTPPLSEQQAIANFLDHKTKQIDQQKFKIQQAIDRLKEYRTALITNAVTGKIDVRQVSIP